MEICLGICGAWQVQKSVLDDAAEKALLRLFVEIGRKCALHFDTLADILLRVGDHLVNHRINHGAAHSREVNVGVVRIFFGECGCCENAKK